MISSLTSATRLLLAGLLVCGSRIAGGQTANRHGPDVEAVPPTAARALAATNVRWRQTGTPHALLYVASDAAGAISLNDLSANAERAITDNLRMLGAKENGQKLRLFFVKSRSDMRRFFGWTPGGAAINEEGTAFFVANDSVRPAVRHETMHLLAWREWGPPAESWLSEGLATAAVPRCRGLNVDQMAAILDRAGRLVPLDTLRHNFVVTGEPGVAHYYEAASLVNYIDRVYGRDRLRALWARGLGTAERTLGVDTAILERAWRARIAHTAAVTSWSSLWREIRAFGCE